VQATVHTIGATSGKKVSVAGIYPQASGPLVVNSPRGAGQPRGQRGFAL